LLYPTRFAPSAPLPLLALPSVEAAALLAVARASARFLSDYVIPSSRCCGRCRRRRRVLGCLEVAGPFVAGVVPVEQGEEVYGRLQSRHGERSRDPAAAAGDAARSSDDLGVCLRCVDV
jgi:hypothetical protein